MLDVAIVRVGDAFTGCLRIEEAASRSSAREVRGATCAEVVEALALIAALSVDPQASTGPRSADTTAPPEPAAAVVALGIRVEGAALADVVLSGGVFGEIALGRRRT